MTTAVLASALPPGPSSSAGMLWSYLRDPLGVGAKLAEKYGPTQLIPGKPPLVLTGDPEQIRAIYAADPDTFVPANQDMAMLLGRHSLLLTAGAEHKRARKLLMPPFHGERMRSYGQAITRIAKERTASWTPGARVEALDTAQRISLDVILEVVLGVEGAAARDELGTLILEAVHGLSPLIALFPALRRELFGLGPWAAFQRRMKRLREAFAARMAAARASPREDILSLLLAARDEAGQPMSDEEVHDQLFTLIVAGHETTAIAISWALYALHRTEHEAILARLRSEVSAAGDSPAELAALPYLEAVCNETLRRYPLAPAPAPRKLLRDLVLGPYTIPAGMAVAPCIGAVHFDPQIYPDPLRFDPERFLGRKYTPFEFIPFGGGARRCIGAALAGYEMKLVVATILRGRELRLASQKEDTGKVRAANAGPKTGIPMFVS